MTTIDNALLGKKLRIVLVDPWDFVTVNGSGPFIADVIQVGRDRADAGNVLLLELSSPLKHGTGEHKYFVAELRHESATFDELLSGASVGCNLTGLHEERAKSANPFDLSRWRGGAAAIADLKLHS